MANTAEAEEQKLEPKSEVAEVGPCKVKLTIEVDAGKVKSRIDEKYKELNEATPLPGFRRGHAPRPLLERKFGKQVLDEIKFELLQKSFEEVKGARELEPLGEPDLDPEKIEVKEGAPFRYEITIEVRPQITLKAYAGLPVKRVPAVVTDADVELELRGLMEARTEWVPADDGIAKPNDQVVADFELVVEGKTVNRSENNALVLSEDVTFYGLVLRDYHKSLAEKKVGDRVEYALKLPETWHDKTQAGKDATIVCAIKSVKRRRLPELNDSFAKSFDMDSMDELKEDLRKRLGRQKETEAQERMADQIVQTILKENEFPLPEGLVNAGTEEARLRKRTHLLMRGASEAEATADAEKAAAESREEVVRSIRERFVLEHIAQKEKIFVTEDQVEERVQRIAGQMGKWPHEVRAYLEEQGLMSSLRRNMREEAVREFLLSKAKIEE